MTGKTLNLRKPLLFSLNTLLLSPCAYSGEEIDETASPIPSSRPRPHGSWFLSAGAGWRQMGQLTLRSGSRSSDSVIPDLFAASGINNPAIGSLGTTADRTYDDGFVRLSGFTGATGLTSNWSYQNSSQVSPTAIDFHATGTRSEFFRNPSKFSSSNDRENLGSIAPQIDLIWKPEHEILPNSNLSGYLFSLSFAGADDTSEYSNFEGSQTSSLYQRNFTDRFLLGGLQGNVPPPGFEGSFTGPGPLIPNTPADRSFSEQLASAEIATISNSIRSRAELSQLSLAFGPVFESQATQRLSWQFSFGPTFSFYDWNTSQDETLNSSIGGTVTNLASSRDRDSGTDFSIGVFARATTVFQLNDQWFMNSYLQGEFATSFEMKTGPSEYKFEPGGFSVGFGIGRSF